MQPVFENEFNEPKLNEPVERCGAGASWRRLPEQRARAVACWCCARSRGTRLQTRWEPTAILHQQWWCQHQRRLTCTAGAGPCAQNSRCRLPATPPRFDPLSRRISGLIDLALNMPNWLCHEIDIMGECRRAACLAIGATVARGTIHPYLGGRPHAGLTISRRAGQTAGREPVPARRVLHIGLACVDPGLDRCSDRDEHRRCCRLQF